jgi:dual oxidase
MIGLLIAHGLDALLQFPMLGYWLAIPTLLVTIERCYRFALGLNSIPAKIEILDAATVCITARLPKYRIWSYNAGQYILLQVPQISIFQWHPFTISSCVGDEIQVHIKTDGDWTWKLRNIAGSESSQLQHIGIDGPFGAPAQHFYEFNHTLIMGSGIGVTPFSGILTDLQAKSDRQQCTDISQSTYSPPTNQSKGDNTPVVTEPIKKATLKGGVDIRRTVAFHWIVKDRNHLLWFSDLLNSIYRSSFPDDNNHDPYLKIGIWTHVTQKRREITTHVFRYLLETHRTPEHPASSLTGLLNQTHFGRPCLATIMDQHYEAMEKLCRTQSRPPGAKTKIGVFFCGTPVIGYELADRCRLLTLRGREDGTRIEYHFSMEVFA